MLPELCAKTALPDEPRPELQGFLKKLEQIRVRASELPVNTIDEQVHVGMEDLQMQEAVNIVKDMIIIETEANPTRLQS